MTNVKGPIWSFLSLAMLFIAQGNPSEGKSTENSSRGKSGNSSRLPHHKMTGHGEMRSAARPHAFLARPLDGRNQVDYLDPDSSFTSCVKACSEQGNPHSMNRLYYCHRTCINDPYHYQKDDHHNKNNDTDTTTSSGQSHGNSDHHHDHKADDDHDHDNHGSKNNNTQKETTTTTTTSTTTSSQTDHVSKSGDKHNNNIIDTGDSPIPADAETPSTSSTTPHAPEKNNDDNFHMSIPIIG